MKNILLIGCGHMGGSLLGSWIGKNNYSITVIDPIENILFTKNNKYKKIKSYKSVDNLKHLITFDFIVFAIKPIDLNNLLNKLNKFTFKKTVVFISVIAGKKINLFEKKLTNIKQVVRVMPNMPALIGEGVNCLVANKNVSNYKMNQIEKLFRYSGMTITFKDEKYIDMATAVSGSGPGFIFNLIDAMEKAAIKLGFKKNIAKILVLETFKGSINLILSNKKNAEDLVKTVATKGGTTEAGLKIMKKYKIHNTFIKLLESSYKRAKKQGNNE